MTDTRIGLDTRADVDSPADAGSGAFARRRGAHFRPGRAGGRGLVAACVVTAGIPMAVVFSLWRNLSEPFWFNEQVRAYYIAKSGDWWATLKVSGAPLAAGWFFLQRASAEFFGSTELSIRLPTALFLPLTSVLLMLLARRWMPLVPAVLVGLLGSLTGTIVTFAVQLSEYQVDAAGAVAVVLLYDCTCDVASPGWHSTRMYLAYAGIAVACIFATPALFLAAPLLAVDLLRALRARSVGPRAVAAAASGLLILLHLGLFVVRQNTLTKSNYWDPQFLPHHGTAKQVSFIYDGIKGFLFSAFTGYYPRGVPGLLGLRWSWILTVCFGLMLALGVVFAARSRPGRSLLLAIGGSLLLTLLASYLRYWPFGFVRTNIYLLPLLVLLAGIGGVEAWRAGTARRARIRPSGRRPALSSVALTAVAVLFVVGVGLAGTYEMGSYRQIRAQAGNLAYGNRIGAAVATVEARAVPGAAVVVAGYMATTGWGFYQFEYTGGASKRRTVIPADHVLFESGHGSPEITRMVKTLRPPQVFLYFPDGTTGPALGSDVKAVTNGMGCRRTAQEGFSGSGVLLTLTCGAPPR